MSEASGPVYVVEAKNGLWQITYAPTGDFIVGTFQFKSQAQGIADAMNLAYTMGQGDGYYRGLADGKAGGNLD